MFSGGWLLIHLSELGIDTTIAMRFWQESASMLGVDVKHTADGIPDGWSGVPLAHVAQRYDAFADHVTGLIDNIQEASARIVQSQSTISGEFDLRALHDLVNRHRVQWVFRAKKNAAFLGLSRSRLHTPLRLVL